MSARQKFQLKMAKTEEVGISMRYWMTYDSVFKRVVRFSGDLSGAMRTFSYSFALALVFKSTDSIKLGDYVLNQDGIARISVPVGLFILFDLLHPFLTLVALHIMGIIRFLPLKKYEGGNMEYYNEKKDKTELIYEMHPLESFGTSILPSLLLGAKIIFVGWTIVEVVMCFNHVGQ